MIEQEKALFAKILGSVALLCSAEINEAIIEVYWKYLKNRFNNIKEFSDTADRVVENWKIVNTFPPASIFIENKVNQTHIEIITQKAWDSVIEAIENGVGYNKTAEFEDKLIPAVVRLCGGFDRLANKTYEELKWIKKEFVKIYKAAVEGNIKLKEEKVTASFLSCKTLFIKKEYEVTDMEFVAIENKDKEILNKLGLKVKRI